MAYYSLVVWTPVEISIRERRLLLDPGTNTFPIELDDIDALTAFLAASGARVIQCNRLDEFDPVVPEPELLPVPLHETPLVLPIGEVLNAPSVTPEPSDEETDDG